MENYLLSNQVGQDRAPNTIRLRKLWTDYATEAQSNGEEALRFEDWAKINYPDNKILSQ